MENAIITFEKEPKPNEQEEKDGHNVANSFAYLARFLDDGENNIVICNNLCMSSD